MFFFIPLFIKKIWKKKSIVTPPKCILSVNKIFLKQKTQKKLVNQKNYFKSFIDTYDETSYETAPPPPPPYWLRLCNRQTQ